MPSVYIVGEAYGEHEERAQAPFVGPSGHVLDGLLRQHGLVRSDVVAIDNVFGFRPLHNDLDTLLTRNAKEAAPGLSPVRAARWLHRDYGDWVHQLHERILAASPNVVLAFGNSALWALTGQQGIKKWRGSTMLASFAPIKVLATYHPAAILRQWNLRPIVFTDMGKALKQAETPEFSRPSRLIHYAPTLEEIESFYHEFILPADYLGADVETKNNTITEIGFSPNPYRCLVIPFWERGKKSGNYWDTIEEELAAWSWVRRICAEKELVGQNFQYDMQYIWRIHGIPTPLVRGDTMLMHHSLQPEMEKGLGFLGSVYTEEPAWKFMRAKHETTKREE